MQAKSLEEKLFSSSPSRGVDFRWLFS